MEVREGTLAFPLAGDNAETWYRVTGDLGADGPAIGFFARAVGLTGALWLVVAAGLVIALLGPRLGSST